MVGRGKQRFGGPNDAPYGGIMDPSFSHFLGTKGFKRVVNKSTGPGILQSNMNTKTHRCADIPGASIALGNRGNGQNGDQCEVVIN